MADDFDPQIDTREITEETGNRQNMEAFPADGAHVACVLITTTKNKAAIRSKLQEIAALADNCIGKLWTANSLPEKRASVRITARVSKNASLET